MSPSLRCCKPSWISQNLENLYIIESLLEYVEFYKRELTWYCRDLLVECVIFLCFSFIKREERGDPCYCRSAGMVEVKWACLVCRAYPSSFCLHCVAPSCCVRKKCKIFFPSLPPLFLTPRAFSLSTVFSFFLSPTFH